jgi:hypothetical protein
MTFILFVLLVYGLCFLASDARIFGCDARSFKEIHDKEIVTTEDEQWIADSGVLSLRQHLLKIKFFRKQLTCYFCTGVWASAIAHIYMYHFFKTDYVMWHPDTFGWWVFGLIGATIIGASSSYLLDVVISAVEARIY